MLKRVISIAPLTLFFIALWLYIGASIAIYGTVIDSGIRHYAEQSYLYRLRISALFSFSFIILSGYFISVSLFYFTYGRRKSWRFRALINSALLIVHFVAFYIFVGQSLSWTDALLIPIGIIDVVLAEVSMHFICRARFMSNVR